MTDTVTFKAVLDTGQWTAKITFPTFFTIPKRKLFSQHVKLGMIESYFLLIRLITSGKQILLNPLFYSNSFKVVYAVLLEMLVD